jgi:hypothetical protein
MLLAVLVHLTEGLDPTQLLTVNMGKKKKGKAIPATGLGDL